MLIQSKKIQIHRNPVLHLNGNRLNFVDSYKYLGCFITNTKSDVCDIKRQTRAICVRANMLIRKFSSCSEEVKIRLFSTFCQNLYCAHLWAVFDKKTIDKLRVTYNNALRTLLRKPTFCSASWLFVNCNVPSFKENLRKCIYGFKTRMSLSNNSLVKAALGQMFCSNGLSMRWMRVLHNGAL